MSSSRPPARRPAPPRFPDWVRAGAVTVGLDFGTHSTKAVLRVRNDPRGLVVFADDPASGYPACAAPSLVRLSRAGQLFFGRRAAELGDGHLFRSLKMDLLPPDWSGRAGGDFPTGTTPDLLVAAYLSWFLGRVRAGLGGPAANRVSLNVAAPMSHVENSALKDRYLHVVHAAWEATFGGVAEVDQGADWAAVGPVLRGLLEREYPGRQHRRFDVLPETLAPLVSLFQDPQTARGLYLMVDMGAGTTELSVSYVASRGANAADRTITCFADRTTRLGGDRFAANDRTHPAGGAAHTAGEGTLRRLLTDEVRRVWYEGFLKVKDGGRAAREEWKRLTAVLSGGGLLRPGLAQDVADCNPAEATGIFRCDPTAYGVRWHRPAGLNLDAAPPGADRRAAEAQSAYLAVADGLSFERRHWPNYYPPAQVRPFDLPHRADGPFDRSYSESDVG